MRAVFRRSWLFSIVAVSGLQAIGQLTDRAASAPRTPLTAEFRITHVQTLSNGTTITRESRETIARDSVGRSLRATMIVSPATDATDTSVSVFDPANGEQVTWNTRNRRAHVLKTPVGNQQRGCWATPSGNATSRFGDARPLAGDASSAGEAAGPALRARTQPVREDLGTDTILGLEVEGVRTTRTIPAGQIGNDQALVRTVESWKAPSLGLTVRQITDDPQTGTTMRELVSIDLSEPSAATFQPPSGYQVVTEAMRPVACPSAP